MSRALNFAGIHTSFPENEFEQHHYDLIFSDHLCINTAIRLQKNEGGVIICTDDLGEIPHINYEVRYALDTLHSGKEIDFLKCDVAYAGEWGDEASQIMPLITCMTQKFTTKIFGPPQMRNIEGYFWDFKTCDIAKNAKISLLLPSSRPEHKWEAIASERHVIEYSGDHESLLSDISNILDNYTYYASQSEAVKKDAWNYETYFHEIICVLNRINIKYDDPRLQPIIESVNYKYDENRLYS